MTLRLRAAPSLAFSNVQCLTIAVDDDVTVVRDGIVQRAVALGHRVRVTQQCSRNRAVGTTVCERLCLPVSYSVRWSVTQPVTDQGRRHVVAAVAAQGKQRVGRSVGRFPGAVLLRRRAAAS